MFKIEPKTFYMLEDLTESEKYSFCHAHLSFRYGCPTNPRAVGVDKEKGYEGFFGYQHFGIPITLEWVLEYWNSHYDKDYRGYQLVEIKEVDERGIPTKYYPLTDRENNPLPLPTSQKRKEHLFCRKI